MEARDLAGLRIDPGLGLDASCVGSPEQSASLYIPLSIRHYILTHPHLFLVPSDSWGSFYYKSSEVGLGCRSVVLW